ncbi:stromal membrane-associated protein 1 isoform X2 [Kryptolebias marmoratus]|uniref:stromal membrane-associated protein 1 isoform X2 n=1 Tax=Kryptolebias marmoratus TaxID=37003 RepID=UPI0018ACED30|nr:stromal membrane-associated protein 1 isoform X2 [Kryptolebias marmoratus]
MTTRSEREKAQKQNEQHQAILSQLLREQDNKYCADCEAKGPRWASWNLGVFMCIRCAGIHRNLGVHISRVKSVNLDQWTPEQIQSMVDMGNSRARQLYEAHLPENFKRPQTDQAVEVFIRDKYERKKFYNTEAMAAVPKSSEAALSSTSPSSQANRTKPEVQKERDKKKEEKRKEKDGNKVEKHNNTKQSSSRTSPKKTPEPAVDLLGLDAPEGNEKGPNPAAAAGNELDMFGPMVSNPLPPSSTKQEQSGSSAAPPQVDTPSSSSSSSSKVEKKKKLLSKDSILSLYGSQPQSQQQPAAGQGACVGQPQASLTPQNFIPPTTMMGGGAMMALPNRGFVQGGPAANQDQNVCNMQQDQGAMNQMTQHMSSVAVSSGGSTVGAPQAGLTTAPASGQTLSTQLWK